MARVTEMGRTPAEPSGNIAAESAFKLNKLFTMLLTSLQSYTTIRAFCADKFFRLETIIFSFFLHQVFTLFKTSKIGFLAFEAFIIRIYSNSILDRLLIVRVSFSGNSLIFVSLLVLESFKGFSFNILIESSVLEIQCLDRRIAGIIRPYLAEWAFTETENNSGSMPSFL